jgi:DNA polymerase III subunit epsilon
MTPWWDQRMVAFDLETTDADPERARIVSYAIADVGGGLATESLTGLVDPGVPIPEEASKVNGVTDDMVRGELTSAEAIPGLLSVLGALAGRPLIAFNARYDLTVLDREARRLGLAPLAPWPVIDPLVIDKHLDRYRKGSRRLDAVCAWYGATLEGAHDAAFDAIAAARCAWVIGAKGDVVRNPRNFDEEAELQELRREWASIRADAGALHDAQVGWAAAQARGLRDHFTSLGQYEDAAEVTEEWPVAPARATTGGTA